MIGNTDRSEEEVLSKSARGDRRTKAPIRRRDKPDINRDERGASDPFEAALLQRTQNLRLQCQRQVSYFVQEQRAPMRHLELAGFSRHGARECPFFVTEELRLEEGFGNRGAVDRDKRCVRA